MKKFLDGLAIVTTGAIVLLSITALPGALVVLSFSHIPSPWDWVSACTVLLLDALAIRWLYKSM